MGAEIHDARREARGRFSGSVAPEDQVGAFAGDGPERSAVRGSYAASDAAAEGSFANAERDVVVTQHEGEERAWVTGRRELKKLLMEAGLDDAAAEADVDALHAGRVLVLVHIAAIPEDEVRAVPDARFAPLDRADHLPGRGMDAVTASCGRDPGLAETSTSASGAAQGDARGRPSPTPRQSGRRRRGRKRTPGRRQSGRSPGRRGMPRGAFPCR
jgi:hypothetical protein